MGGRVCTKCLLRELAGIEKERAAELAMIEKYRGAIKPGERAEEQEYERRLLVCRGCEKLLAGTCISCGCYVELRAAAKRSHCPKKKW